MIFTGTELVCPRVTSNAPMVINLAAILTAEARQDEVAMVTPQKAPELLAEFNRAWRDLHQLVVQLTSERVQAEKAAERRRAFLLLEEVPRRLKDRNLASNDANREAVIVLDAEHQRLQEIADQIEAVVEYLKGKLKSFENAYTSVKKIMGEDSYSMSGSQNQNLKGDTAARTLPGFGRPRY